MHRFKVDQARFNLNVPIYMHENSSQAAVYTSNVFSCGGGSSLYKEIVKPIFFSKPVKLAYLKLL